MNCEDVRELLSFFHGAHLPLHANAEEPPLRVGSSTAQRALEQMRGAMRRCKESSREAAMRQYLTRKHHLLRALAVALFYEAFGVRVSRKCY